MKELKMQILMNNHGFNRIRARNTLHRILTHQQHLNR